MKTATITTVLLSLLFCLIAVPALAEDIQGSKDHPLLKRYEGSEIIKYDQKSFDSYIFPVGPANDKSEIQDRIDVEGALTRLTYKAPVGRSPLEVVRNYEEELLGQGFELLYKGSKSDLGPHFPEVAGYKSIEFPPNVPAFILNEDNQHYRAYKKTDPAGGDIYVVLYAIVQKFWASDLKGVEKNQAMIQVDIVETKPMERKMVTVTADEMAQEIASSGGVALYGILFDFNKADIKPESAETLTEMAKFLKTSTNEGFLVVGHTDSVGSYEANLTLSQRRAEAVVNALAGQYGVDKSKLKPVGIAFASPKATNRTEEGRAKNRRVELVEY